MLIELLFRMRGPSLLLSRFRYSIQAPERKINLTIWSTLLLLFVCMQQNRCAVPNLSEQESMVANPGLPQFPAKMSDINRVRPRTHAGKFLDDHTKLCGFLHR